MLDAFEREAAAVPLRAAAAAPRLQPDRPAGRGREVTPAALLAPPRARGGALRRRPARARRRCGPTSCVEIGPHPTLLAFARADLGRGGPGRPVPALVPSLRKGRDDCEQMLEALGALYLAGVAIDWRGVQAGERRSIVDLPTYPFQRERCWFRAAPRAGSGAGAAAGRDTGHPLLGRGCAAPAPRPSSRRASGADAARASCASTACRAAWCCRPPPTSRPCSPPAREVLGERGGLGRGRDPAGGDAAGRRWRGARRCRWCAAPSATAPSTPPSPARPRRWRPAQGAVEGDAWTRHATARLCSRPQAEAVGSRLATPVARCERAAARRCGPGTSTLASSSAGSASAPASRWCGSSGGATARRWARSSSAPSWPARRPLPPAPGAARRLPADAGGGPPGACVPPARGPRRSSTCRWASAATRATGRPATAAPATSRCGRAARARAGPTCACSTRTARWWPSCATCSWRCSRATPWTRGAPGADRWLDDALYEVAWRPAPAAGGGRARAGARARRPPRRRPPRAARARSGSTPTTRSSRGSRRSAPTTWCGRWRRLGWTPAPGEPVDAAALAARLGVVPRHRRLFERLLAILAEDGWLRREAGGLARGEALGRGRPTWAAP